MLQFSDNVIGTVTVIRVAGSPNEDSLPTFSPLLNKVRDCLTPAAQFLVLNLGNNPELNSEDLLIELIRANVMAREAGARLRLCEVPQGLLYQMQDCKVIHMFKIDPTESRSLAQFANNGQTRRLRA